MKLNKIIKNVLLSSFILYAQTSHAFTYPETEKTDHTDTYHGVEISDPYNWLEDGNDDNVKNWTRHQNSLSKKLANDQQTNQAILERYKEVLVKERSYVLKLNSEDPINEGRILVCFQDANLEHPIIYLAEDIDSPLIEVINPNTWNTIENLEYFKTSPDGQILAYGVSTGANESPRAIFLDISDLENIQEMNDKLWGLRHSDLHWHPDSEGVYYTAFPSKNESNSEEDFLHHKILYHSFGSAASEDVIILDGGGQEGCLMDIYLDAQGLCLSCSHQSDDGLSSYKAYSMDPSDPNPETLELMEEGRSDDVTNKEITLGDETYILTNHKAANFKLVQKKTCLWGKWNYETVIIPESEGIIQAVHGLNGHILVEYMNGGESQFKVFTIDGKHVSDIDLPGPSHSFAISNWDNDYCFIASTTLTQPFLVYCYDFDEQSLEVLSEAKIPGYDPENYVTKKVWLPSKDGTKVPMFIASHKDLENADDTPLLLTGYGGFNISKRSEFSSFYLPWLEGGYRLAIPCIRGGGELGQKWYEDGVRHQKQNSYDDFIAAAEYLINENYTSPDKLAIFGVSNGGLLTGAAMTQHPELFRCVVSAVPVLDMLRFHHFRICTLNVPEYGSADKAEDFPYLHAYSPYHNITDGVDYPPSLFYSATNDRRVDPLHARKMVAQLQESTGSELNPILLHEDPENGHFGSTLQANLRIRAKQFAFLMKYLEIKPKGGPKAAKGMCLKKMSPLQGAQALIDDLKKSDNADQILEIEEIIRKHQRENTEKES
jgi:prolyl oligopeptidase